jgi:hypothetical protein
MFTVMPVTSNHNVATEEVNKDGKLKSFDISYLIKTTPARWMEADGRGQISCPQWRLVRV